MLYVDTDSSVSARVYSYIHTYTRIYIIAWPSHAMRKRAEIKCIEQQTHTYIHTYIHTSVRDAEDVRDAATRRARELERIKQAEIQARRQRRAALGDAADSDSDQSDGDGKADVLAMNDSFDSGMLVCMCICVYSVHVYVDDFVWWICVYGV